MVRSRLREGAGQADDTPVRKGSKEGTRKKGRRPVGSPLDSDDEDAFGACDNCEEDEEGLEGLGVPLDSVVKVSMLKEQANFAVLGSFCRWFQFDSTRVFLVHPGLNNSRTGKKSSLCQRCTTSTHLDPNFLGTPRFGASTAPPTFRCHGSGDGSTVPAGPVS